MKLPESPAKCIRCNKDHDVHDCPSFKDLTQEQRYEEARKHRLCFNCLEPGHNARECRRRGRCIVKDCGRKHHTLLHQDSANVAVNGYAGRSSNGAGTKRIALPIVAVKVRAPGKSAFIKTYALLDSGSTSSFCSEKLLTKLGVETSRKRITLTTLDRAETVINTTVSTLEISDLSDNISITLPMVYSKNTLPIPEANIATLSDISHFPHLQGIDLPNVSCDEVMLLIGQDCPVALTPRTIIAGGKDEPYAVRTSLGWTLNGPIKSGTSSKVISNFVNAGVTLSEQIEKFWKVDSAELYSEEKAMSVSDNNVLKMWESSAVHIDDHYEMPIPFKKIDLRLPDNKGLAIARLDSLKRKFNKDSSLKQQYIDGMNDLLDKGYAVEATEDPQPGRTWYLPHHPVVNPNKENYVLCSIVLPNTPPHH